MPLAKTMFATRSGVGTTTGKPSVKPAMCNASSAAPSSDACMSSVMFQLLNNLRRKTFGHVFEMTLSGSSQGVR
jgi:hypothetical protein